MKEYRLNHTCYTRIVVTLCLSVLLTISTYGQKREIHILAANDMHANIKAFPQLAAIADSLRTLYPQLLILSAGDNRTGNPLNDMYKPSSYPMVALMNTVGFHATTLGNHEFDVHSLEPLIGLSAFNYICANIFPTGDKHLGIVPTQVFDVDGLKIGVIGTVQVNPQGRPDTHPDNVKDYRFASPLRTVARYMDFSEQCDATILLSHIGYEDDIKMAEEYPWLDLIIGGHSHTQLTADEPLHNGVLITQNSNRLSKVTHITLTLWNGRITDKKAEYIDVPSFPKSNRIVQAMVDYFSDNPDFKQVIAQAATPFETSDEISYMMCDAFREETRADIGLVNPGNVRLNRLPAGNITVFDILSMDPFYNEAVILRMTIEELVTVMTTYSRGTLNHLPRISGLICEVTVDKDNTNQLKRIRLLTEDGKDPDYSKVYSIATSSYMSAVMKSLLSREPEGQNRETSSFIIDYLERKGAVSYQGISNMRIIKE